MKGKFAGENNPMWGKPCTMFMSEEKIQKWRENMKSGGKKTSEWFKTHKRILCEDGKRHYVKID